MNLFVEELLPHTVQYVYKLILEPKHKTGSEDRAKITEYCTIYRGPSFLAAV